MATAVCTSRTTDTSNEFAEILAHADVDVAGEQQRGVLRIVSQRDSYLRYGQFTPQAMIDFIRQQESAAVAEGRSGLRILGEMTWALGPGIGSDRLIEYEALLNDFLPNSRTTAVCQYDHGRFDPPVIYDLFRTHPLVILGDQVCPHPFYEPPQMVLGQASMAERVDWRIAQLKQARSTEQLNQQRQALLHAVVEGTSDALFVKDRQGRYLMINSAGAQLLGKSAEEVVGKDDLELFTAGRKPRVRSWNTTVESWKQGHTRHWNILRGLGVSREDLADHEDTLP